MEIKDIVKIPKVELHCHLDGSVSLDALRKISELPGTPDMDERIMTAASLRVADDCPDLGSYLGCFARVMPFLQTSRGLSLAAQDVVRQAHDDGCLYTEIRFAPFYFTQSGLTNKEIIVAVLKGCETGEQMFGTKSGIILCMMRGLPCDENSRVLAACKEFAGYGVCGIDLAGNEAQHPQKDYRDLFEAAHKAGLNITCHAGECGSAENVTAALEVGARRIGHGIAAAHSQEAMQLCRAAGATLEMCPTSNVQTKAVDRMEEHPFPRMQDAGVNITLNTDNRTVSNTTVTEEIYKLCQVFPSFGMESVWKAQLSAANGAFLPGDERAKLRERINAFFNG